jgi:predicted AAA+ superfamily ATPase
MSQIYKRDIIDEIGHYLHTDEIIVLHGARQVGKTSIMLYLQDQIKREGFTTFFIDLEDSRLVRMLDGGIDEFRKHLREEGILKDGEQKKAIVFIDEIQYLANPSEFLKLAADHHKDIKLIVSGSSSFAIKSKFKDSLAGRTVDFEIFNLSFSEFLAFRNIPLVGDSFTEKKIAELKSLFKDYALYGGYPKIVLTPEVFRKEKYLQQIIDTYVKMDIRDLANIREPDKFNKLLEALASQSGQILNVAELANTTKITKPTIERYLFILENTFIIKLVRPYSSNLRSELFKQPKIFFYDSGLAQMLWLKGLQKELLGSVFETALFSELVKKYSRDNIFYWRTKDKKEIDFIIKTKDKFLPVEVKINFAQFNPTAVKYFNRHYGLDDYRLIGIEGAPKNEKEIHPWGL